MVVVSKMGLEIKQKQGSEVQFKTQSLHQSAWVEKLKLTGPKSPSTSQTESSYSSFSLFHKKMTNKLPSGVPPPSYLVLLLVVVLVYTVVAGIYIARQRVE